MRGRLDVVERDGGPSRPDPGPAPSVGCATPTAEEGSGSGGVRLPGPLPAVSRPYTGRRGAPDRRGGGVFPFSFTGTTIICGFLKGTRTAFEVPRGLLHLPDKSEFEASDFVVSGAICNPCLLRPARGVCTA
jgi:hypothetical protein